MAAVLAVFKIQNFDGAVIEAVSDFRHAKAGRIREFLSSSFGLLAVERTSTDNCGAE